MGKIYGKEKEFNIEYINKKVMIVGKKGLVLFEIFGSL